MPLCQSHIKWMTQAWSKRLCQSCGLPVSQVLMCALSATLTEKIGHLAHFQQPSYHLQSIQRFLPFLVDVSAMSLWVSDSVSLLLCSCTVIFVWLFLFFLVLMTVTLTLEKIEEKQRRGGETIYSRAHGNSKMNNSLKIIFNKAERAGRIYGHCWLCWVFD